MSNKMSGFAIISNETILAIFKHCAKMSGSHKHVRRDKEMIIELLCLFVYLDRKLVNLESPSVLYIVVGDVWSPQL